MKVTLLGTGGPQPDPDRMASTVLIKAAGHKFLVDAGRGVTTRLVQCSVNPEDIDRLFITHLHFDHIGNLGELLLSMWNNGRIRPLQIYGPKGIAAIIDALLAQVYLPDILFREKEAALSGDPLPDLRTMLEVVEIDAGSILDLPDIKVHCQRVSHGIGIGISHDEWPCLGFNFTSKQKSVAISGDTVDCEGLGILARDSDLLVLCCYLADEEQTASEREMLSRHLLVSSAEAGKIAEKYNVKKLALTHIRRKSERLLVSMEEDIRADYSGKIIVGKDLLEIVS